MSEVCVSRVLLPRDCRLHLACLHRHGRPLASLTVCFDSTRELDCLQLLPLGVPPMVL